MKFQRFGAIGTRIALLLAAAGCAPPGLLYTDVVEPFCVDMNNTSIGGLSGSSATLQVRIPFVAPGLTAVWNSNAIADAAASSGITELQYCDLRTFSIFFGIYKRQNIVVYGN